MAVGVLMPKAGITVEECVITEWLKKKGDQVKVGDILFTYETDKASFECESTAEGTLLEIFYEDGDEVPCLVNVCAIGQPGDSIEGIKEGTDAPAAAPAAAAPAAEAPAAAPAAVAAPKSNPDAKVSPRARAAAKALGVDPTCATGTGAHGRVMEKDVQEFAKTAPKMAAAGKGATGVVMPKAGITVEECVITEWAKKVGDQVKIGDILFTYETDKASFECESTAEGTLLEVFYEDGDEVPCLYNVCAIGDPGDNTEGLKGSTDPNAAKGAAVAAAPTQAAAAAPAAGTGALGVVMPKAGITVEECIITEWTKKVGDQVKIGDILFTYETDKASFECESTAEGTLLEIFYEDGDEVPCLENVCAVGNPGDSTVGLKGSTNPNAAREAAAAAAPVVEAAAEAPAAAAAPAAAPAPAAEAAPAEEAEYVDEKFSPVRKATAKAMVRSLTEMAQLTHYHSFDATAIQAMRKQIKANAETMGLPNITLNDMIMFAVSRVILNHPELNAIMPQENVLRKYKHVHLGMAVDTPKGLFVPTIFNADQMTLAQMCLEAKRIAKLAQEGKATPDMLSGASFTVSNPGSLGVEMFTPVVNPPQVGILGVCGITTGVKEVNGELKAYPKMGLCLSYDHRALDGTPASKFMKELCNALEHFDLLMLK